MPDTDSLRRLGGGRWETRDGRFTIEPQSGTWVVVDNEQTDELGLPLVRGPFGSLTAAKGSIEAARTEGPKVSPLAARLENAREQKAAPPKASTAATSSRAATSAASGAATTGSDATSAASEGATTESGRRPEPSPARPGSAPRDPRSAPRNPGSAPTKPEPQPEPAWLRDLEPSDQRRARNLIARLEKMEVADPERVARAEIAQGQPALARLALERAIARAIASGEIAPDAARSVIRTIVRGADVELGASWRLVDDQGRRIERLEIPE